MIWLWDNAVTIANVVMAAAAIAALIYAHLQINEGKRAERRANAHQLWNETLHLAFDNPKLSDPTLKLAEFDYEARTIDGSIETFQKYELYVDTILNASEAILDVSPTKEWDIAVRFQLNPHRDYLLSQYFQKFGLSRAIHAAIPGVPEGCAGQPLQGSAAAEARPDRLSREEGEEACLSSSSTTKSTMCRTASR